MRHARRVSGTSRRFTAAGKIVLAAIVHHDTISTDLTDPNSNTDPNDVTARKSSPQESMSVGARSTKTTGNNNNNGTHQDDKIFPIPGRRKLSKLFSTTKKRQQQQTTTTTTTTATTEEEESQEKGAKTTPTLIGGGKINENLAQNEWVNLLQPPPTMSTHSERPNSNEQYHHHSPLHHHNHLQQHRHQHNSYEKYLQQAEHTTTTSYGHKRKQTGQVIEFKFDLIVDQESQSMWNCTDSLFSSGSEQVKASSDEATTTTSGTGKAGRVEPSNMKCKLNDNVNELVESFVLDSNDVCLMSIGAPEVDLNTKHHSTVDQVAPVKAMDEFEYLSQLVTHSLAYSFHLLSCRQQQQQQSPAGDGGEQRAAVKLVSGKQQSSLSSSSPDDELHLDRSHISCDPASSTAANNYSIELSATLFLCAETSDEATTCKPINIAAADPSHPTLDAGQKPPTRRAGGDQEDGCFSIHDLLAKDDDDDDSTGIKSTTGRAGQGLGQWLYDERREVFTNGSASSSPPSTSMDCSTVEEALVVVESIKAELRRLQLGGSLRTSKKTLIPIFESIFNGQALAHLKRRKIHLQALESEDLHHLNIDDHGFNSGPSVGVESTKQHHQVASLNKLIRAEWLLYKQLSSALIRTLLVVHVHKLVSPARQVIYNTTTNETLQRRLEMESGIEQRIMSDNLVLLEFARSLQRASCVKLKRRKKHLKSHLASSELSLATSNISATTNTNELLASSPVRVSRLASSSSLARNAHTRKASLDMNLALSRHHHRHHHHHHHHHQQRNITHNNSSRHPAHRCQTLQRQSDLTESSSVSSSSGSQGTAAARRIVHCSDRSSRSRTPHKNHHSYFERDNFCNNLSSLNNLSDSDSVTSANLNSCSSSSYQPTAGCQQWESNHSGGGSSGGKNGVNLKWSAKRHHLRKLKHSMDDGSSPSSIELSTLKCSTSGQTKPRSSSISRRRDRSSSRAGGGGGEMEEMRMASKASSVIQIDCNPNRKCDSNLSFTGDHCRTRQVMQIDGDATRMSDKTLDLDDNMSDICSVIAEPPKQLKLEKFLNQLSSIIAPITTTTTHNSPQARLNGHSQGGGCELGPTIRQVSREDIVSNGVTNGMMCTDGYDDSENAMMSLNLRQSSHYCYSAADTRQQRERHIMPATNKSNGNGLADEDDEDCKSHSSILEHLSTLALESNTKLNNRQLQLDYQIKSSHLSSSSDSSPIEQTQLDRHHHHHEIVLQSPHDCAHTMLAHNNDEHVDPLGLLHQSSQGKSPMGHLQRLLNSSARKVSASSRVTLRDPSTIEDQLRALSISCQVTKSTSPSASSGVFISSNESSCSSSAATG